MWSQKALREGRHRDRGHKDWKRWTGGMEGWWVAQKPEGMGEEDER